MSDMYVSKKCQDNVKQDVRQNVSKIANAYFPGNQFEVHGDTSCFAGTQFQVQNDTLKENEGKCKKMNQNQEEML